MPKKLKTAKPGTGESYQNVLIEEMKSRMDHVIDVVENNSKSIKEFEGKIESVKQELKEDIKITQQALSKRIDNVEKNLSERIDKNTDEIRILNRKVDKNTDEIRILNRKVDKNTDRLDHHEEEITQ